jgi:hypothetical protein
MTNKEILKKSIEKAYKNGWDKEPKQYKNLTLIRCAYYRIRWFDTQLILAEIFSHDFAKAFFGEKQEEYFYEFQDKVGYILDNYGYISSWQYHLMNMVLEKEPLKYLEKFL